jgi:hypothetical protein
MHRAGKRVKAKDPAKLPVTKSSRSNESSRVRDLEKRLAEALEQQAATSEILQVISRSRSDVQPVFDAIARKAADLCEARTGVVYRFDGELIHVAAQHKQTSGMTPEQVEALSARFGPWAPYREWVLFLESGDPGTLGVIEVRPTQRIRSVCST